MPEYTLAATTAALAVVAAELTWLRTGLFRTRAFWVSWAIILFFMVLVDGWLTKLSAPIVLYDRDHTSGVRIPWDIPVEDYLFGFAMVTAAMLGWDVAGRRVGER